MQYLLVGLFFLMWIATCCEIPNDCSGNPDAVYCIDGVCMECDPTELDGLARKCMCSAGKYCVASPQDSGYGTCREKEETILGRNCDKTLKGQGLAIVKQVNDTVFCGNIAFNNDYTASFVEWEGQCVQGICRECGTSAAPCLPTGLCPDLRTCYRNEEVYAYVGVYSFKYTKDVPLFFGFYISVAMTIVFTPISAIFLLVIGYYIIKVKKQAKKTGEKIHLWYDPLLDLFI